MGGARAVQGNDDDWVSMDDNDDDWVSMDDRLGLGRRPAALWMKDRRNSQKSMTTQFMGEIDEDLILMDDRLGLGRQDFDR